MGSVSPAPAETGPDTSAVVPAEDYPLYDLIVDEKFLTPETKLVVLERVTLTRLPGATGPLRPETFHQYEIFDDRLPGELIRDFLVKNQAPSKLDGRFGFGVRYRFVYGDGAEQQETSLPSILVSESPRFMQEEPLDEPPAILDRLAFSRVAYTLGREQALIYVEYNRPTGAGAGLRYGSIGPEHSGASSTANWSGQVGLSNGLPSRLRAASHIVPSRASFPSVAAELPAR